MLLLSALSYIQQSLLTENLKTRRHSGHLGTDRRIILKWSLNKIRLNWLRARTCGGLLWTRNEPLGSIKGGEFLDQLSDYQFVKKDSAARSWRYFPVKAHLHLIQIPFRQVSLSQICLAAPGNSTAARRTTLTCFVVVVVSCYFSSWSSGEPHHSGFKFQIVALLL
jgi:hypothetical protein